jgi:hypothetical protein
MVDRTKKQIRVYALTQRNLELKKGGSFIYKTPFLGPQGNGTRPILFNQERYVDDCPSWPEQAVKRHFKA